MDHPLSYPPRLLVLATACRRSARAVAGALWGAAVALGACLPAQAQTPAAGNARAGTPVPPDATAPRVQTLSKCTAANGRVTYSDSTCPAGSRGAALQVEPDNNVVATTPIPAAVPSPATFAPPQPPAAPPVAPPVAQQPYLPPPNAGMPARQAADCAMLDRRAATLGSRAMQPQTGDNPQLLPNEQRSVEDLRQYLGCE